MRNFNPYLKLAREARDAMRTRGLALTSNNVRAELERDVSAYKVLVKQLDPQVAVDALVSQAIRKALYEYGPAWPGPDGPEHVDVDAASEADLRRVIGYQRRMIADDQRKLVDLEVRLARIETSGPVVVSEPVGI